MSLDGMVALVKANLVLGRRDAWVPDVDVRRTGAPARLTSGDDHPGVLDPDHVVVMGKA